MNRRSTIFLKFVLVLIGALALFILLYFPQIEGRNVGKDIFYTYFTDPVLAYVYLMAVLFFISLGQAFKILSLIEQNKVFTQTSVNALRNIKRCAVIISVMFAALLPLMLQFGQQDDAPGFVLLGVVIVFATSVIATGAGVAQKLLQQAVDLQSENDLTV